MNWSGQDEALGCTRRRLAQILIAAVAGSGLLAAPTAQASVTVGSPLTGPFFSTSTCGDPGGCTRANTALGDPGARVTSPVSGQVVRWRIAGNYGGAFKLRVLRPANGGQYRGVGTSAPVTATGTATLTIPTNLPVEPGDLIGVDYGDGKHLSSAMVTGSAFGQWLPALADGDTAPPTPFASNLELLYNADVEPASAFTVGKPKLNKKRGTAMLPLTVPNPGAVNFTGKGVAKGTISVSAPETVNVPVRAIGRPKTRKLNRDGEVKVTPIITYAPTGGAVGNVHTQKPKMVLKKKL
jgi:hypothetical protein